MTEQREQTECSCIEEQTDGKEEEKTLTLSTLRVAHLPGFFILLHSYLSLPLICPQHQMNNENPEMSKIVKERDPQRQSRVKQREAGKKKDRQQDKKNNK